MIVGGNFTVGDYVNIARYTSSGYGSYAIAGNTTDFPPTGIAVQNDGKVVIWGTFTNVGGTAVNHIARLNADMSLDTSFSPEPNGGIFSVTVQPDGKLLVHGGFNQICGVSSPSFVRLNVDGTLDSSFTGPTNINFSALQPDGKILIGGNFTTIHGVSRLRFARLNSNGSLDTSFEQTLIDLSAQVVLPLASGKIMIGGTRLVNSNVVPIIARLNSDGSLDSSFTTASFAFTSPAGPTLVSLIEQADGKVVYASWSEVGRLNIDGSVDSSFTPWTPTLGETSPYAHGGQIFDLIPLNDGSYGVVAQLWAYDYGTATGYTRTCPKLSNDPGSVPAVQDLKAVDGGTRLVWTPSGARPIGGFAEFEISNNNFNWSPLGVGTPISGGWELSGLSLTQGGNYYIRAVMRTSDGATGGTGYISEVINTRRDIDVIASGYYNYFYDTDIAGATQQKTYTIYNRGAFDLTISNIAISGTHAADYSFSSASLPIVIGPYQNTEVIVTFNPSALGNRTATLVITSDDPDEAITNNVMSGDGINPELDIYGLDTVISSGDTSPSSTDGSQFGNVTVGYTSQRTFELRNTGTTPLDITSISSSNGRFICNAYPAIVPAGQKLDLVITFTATSSPFTAEQSTITVQSSDYSEGTYTFVVEATEISPTLRVKGNSIIIPKGDTTPRVLDHTDFGSVETVGVQIITRYFTLENIGSGPLTITGVSGVPSVNSGFVLYTPVSSTIAEGSSTTMRVDFNPSMNSIDTEVISITSDSSTGATHTFSIKGTGLRPELTVRGNGFSIAAADYTPSPIDHTEFGNVATSAGLTTEFVFQNTGTSSLWLQAVNTYGTGYTHALAGNPSLPLELLPNDSISLGVTLTPLSAGSFNGYVAADWSDEPIYSPILHDFDLHGTGVVSGSVASSYTPTTGDASIYASAVQSNGKVIIGGNFTNVNSASPARPRLARLNTDGTLDTSFAPSFSAGASVETIIIQPDGKILVGGTFTTIAGGTRTNLARLNTDGTLDTSFTANCTGGIVKSIAREDDGDIIIGGAFTNVNAASPARPRMARVSSSGTLDTGFTPSIASGIECLTLQNDGKILAVGTFVTTPRNYFARFNTNGTHDSTFGSNVGTITGTLNTVAVQQDGSIIVAGAMSAPRYKIARYSSSGSHDTSFTPPTVSTTGAISSVGIQADGKIYIGGIFTGVTGATTRRYLVRLNANGTLDSYDAAFATTTSGTCTATLPLLSGRLFVGGVFTPPSGGVKRTAILENGAAVEELQNVGGDIYWYRDGALPEVRQITFESWNGSSWTAHTGTLAQITGGGGWKLTGVSPSLPSSGKLRAKAFYGVNGSGSYFTSQESQY